jgi:dTMP kinase
MSRGVFIAIEGIDGSGTTTHTKLLAKWLRASNFSLLITHEPTDREIGRLIRERLKDASVPPATDALLFAADRVDHTLQEINPALERGTIVISDRYVESSIAYQSSSGLELEWVAEINKYAISPDLTILLDIDPDTALQRKRHPKPMEKFEHISFLKKVREVFLTRAQTQGFEIVNAEKSISKVQAEIQKLVKPILNKP